MATQAYAPAGETATRPEPRIHDQRSEERHEGLLDCATLHFRGAVFIVPVVNISSRGTMIESDVVPRLGESVIIRFAGCDQIYAFVRWVRDGRIGLNFGCELTIG